MILTVALLAGAASGVYLYTLKPKDLEKVKPDYVMTSAELQRSFEEDEVAATAKYVNKIIEVSGDVSSVTSGENNSLNISLKTDSDLSSVICTFPESGYLGKSDIGTQLSVRGECSGYLMDVLLKNCVVVSK